MQFRSVLLGLVAAAGLAATTSAQLLPPLDGGSSSAPPFDPVQLEISQAIANDKHINVVPFEFDPNNLNLAHASWLTGTGCPALDLANPLCTGGDPNDKRNEGLLLVKTGSTGNLVAAGARINGVKGLALSDLGYDLRKPRDTADPAGSQCGAGAPRFNITIEGVTYFIGCDSPPPVQIPLGTGWIRLRWAGVVPGTLLAFNSETGALENIAGRPVQSITIIFDEGQDVLPENFGAAVLDNIKVNSQIAGRGPHGGK
jgi:hypothetical protein